VYFICIFCTCSPVLIYSAALLPMMQTETSQSPPPPLCVVKLFRLRVLAACRLSQMPRADSGWSIHGAAKNVPHENCKFSYDLYIYFITKFSTTFLIKRGDFV